MLADHQTKVAILLIAFLLMVAITYWQPMLGVLVYLSSIGLDYLLSQFGFNTSQTISVGQGMLVTLTLTVMLKQHLTPVRTPWAVLWLWGGLVLFITSLWASCAFGLALTRSVMPSAVITANVALPITLFYVVTTTKRFQQLLWALGIAATLAAAIGCLQYAGVLLTLSQDQRQTVEDTRGSVMEYQANTSLASQGTRYAGPTSNPNGFAAVLMGGIPALLFLPTLLRSLWAKLTTFTFLGICCFALLLTMSRTHILGFFFVALFITLFNRGRHWLTRLLYFMVGTATLVLFTFGMFQLEGVNERLYAGFTDGGDTSSQTRAMVALGGLRAWIEHPLLGLGLNNTQIGGYNPTGNASHDIFTTLLGELGTFGFIAFALVVYQAVQLIRRAPADSPSNGEEPIIQLVGPFLLISLLVCLGSGLGDPVIDNRNLWILLGMCACAHHIATLQSAEVEAAATDELMEPGDALPTAA